MPRQRKPTELTVNQIIARLTQIRDKHGNMKVYFDTEAGQFHSHYVGIRSVWYASEALIGEKHAYMTTGDPIEHVCQWKNDNIKLNFAAMANIRECKSQWQLSLFNLPIRNSKLPQTHESDKAFFKKYWKLDKRSYERVMKEWFPGWLETTGLNA